MKKQKPSGNGIESKNFETGLDTISFSKLGAIYLPGWTDGKSVETIFNECTALAENTTAPEHIRYLATMTAFLAQDLNRQLKRKQPNIIEVAQIGILFGVHCERLALWENERPAQAGKRSRAAAQKKGRAARVDSLRYFFDTRVRDWRNKGRGALLILAKTEFPNSTQADLSRQIRRLKKADNKA